MNDLAGPIGDTGVVAVVTLDDVESGVPLARALVAGGLPFVEITVRTDAGLPAIGAIADGVDGATVGAGSVMTTDDADAVIDAGARFVVSPGLDGEVVDSIHARGVLALPGIATATELMRARRHGIDVVKLFPAEAAGGVALISSLSAVWPDVRFVPTGGITPENAMAYLAHRSVLAVGGSWMVPRDLIAAGDWGAIERLAAEAAILGRSTP